MRLHFIFQEELTLVFWSGAKDIQVSALATTAGWIFLDAGVALQIGNHPSQELTFEQTHILRTAIKQARAEHGIYGYCCMIIPEFNDTFIAPKQPSQAR